MLFRFDLEDVYKQLPHAYKGNRLFGWVAKLILGEFNETIEKMKTYKKELNEAKIESEEYKKISRKNSGVKNQNLKKR